MSDTHKFPSPVGGVAFPSDLAPSIIFAIMYGFLLPLLGYRIWSRKSRNVLLGGSLIFGVERIVIFSLRAVQARHVGARESKGMNEYMQCTIGAGFIAISQDLVSLLRAALVNSTQPSRNSHELEEITSPKSMPDSSGSSMTILRISEVADSQEDQPRRRYWYRRCSDLLNVGFLGAQVLGLFGNSIISQAMEKPHKAKMMMSFRYASSGLALFFSIVLAAIAMWASAKIPRFKRSAGMLILLICGLSSIPTIYRLCVMYHTTTSLTSTSPGSQNTPAEKAVFYIFHIIPEWIAVLMLLSCNVRDVFGTGMFGDDRVRDETESEKAARQAKELYKAERKTGTNVGIHEEDLGMFSKFNQLRRCKV